MSSVWNQTVRSGYHNNKPFVTRQFCHIYQWLTLHRSCPVLWIKIIPGGRQGYRSSSQPARTPPPPPHPHSFSNQDTYTLSPPSIYTHIISLVIYKHWSFGSNLTYSPPPNTPPPPTHTHTHHVSLAVASIIFELQMQNSVPAKCTFAELYIDSLPLKLHNGTKRSSDAISRLL